MKVTLSIHLHIITKIYVTFLKEMSYFQRDVWHHSITLFIEKEGVTDEHNSLSQIIEVIILKFSSSFDEVLINKHEERSCLSCKIKMACLIDNYLSMKSMIAYLLNTFQCQKKTSSTSFFIDTERNESTREFSNCLLQDVEAIGNTISVNLS